LNAAQRKVSELSGRVSELDEALNRTQRELGRAQENNAKLQRDLRENAAQKVDQVRCNFRSSSYMFTFLFFLGLTPWCR